jgi:tight adherence protein C
MPTSRSGESLGIFQPALHLDHRHFTLPRYGRNMHPAAFLTFLTIVAIGLVCYGPAYRQHCETYGVRIRQKRKEQLKPVVADSLLMRCLMVTGRLTVSALPAVADERTAKLLIQANLRSPDHVLECIGAKVLFCASTSLLLVSTQGNLFGILIFIPAALGAWMLPNFFLLSVVSKRRKALVMELPTVVDLLIVTAQAGLGLLMSIDKVCKEVKETCPILADEFSQLVVDIKTFGSPTSVALQQMDDRCEVEELSNLTSTLIACDAKGSDLSYPLKQQSDHLRHRLKRKREEEASKTPVKMVPVIMIFIMPLILCPMLGPAMLIIVEALGGALHGR